MRQDGELDKEADILGQEQGEGHAVLGTRRGVSRAGYKKADLEAQVHVQGVGYTGL